MNGQCEDLGKLIGHASVLFHRNFDNVVSAEGAHYADFLSGRNIWILRYVHDCKGEDVFQRDLENVFKIRRSTVSANVDLMERKGLLIRESVNGDARLKRLRLTPKAEELLEAVSAGIGRLENSVRNSFTPEDYQRLTELLGALCRILEKPLPANPENSKERNHE